MLDKILATALREIGK